MMHFRLCPCLLRNSSEVIGKRVRAMLSRMLSLAWDGLDNFPVLMDGWMDG